MCRFVAYLGDPVCLDTVVCTPRQSLLQQALLAARRGATDSALLFLLALARIDAGEPATVAMQAVLASTQALMARQGIAEPLRFAAALSDGEQLLAFRYASDNKPPTLYVSKCEHGSSVASESLDAHPGLAERAGQQLGAGQPRWRQDAGLSQCTLSWARGCAQCFARWTRSEARNCSLASNTWRLA